MYNQQSPFLDYRNIFSGKSIMSKLIIINIAVWLGINLFKVILFLFKINNLDIIEYLGVPSDFHILLSRPWTLITYMFTQEGFLHILFNMIMLYFGGLIFVEYLNEKQLLSTYIIGGIFGALFFILSYNIFPAFKGIVTESIAIGASASVLAVFIAIAVYIPNYTIYLFLVGRIKLIYVAFIFLAVDLLSINKGNPGGHLAHIGGALWGYIYIFQLKKGRDISSMLAHLLNLRSLFKKRRTKFKIEYKREGKPLTDEEYNANRAEKQKKIDEILDKIAKRGYESLSKEEKEFLFKSGSNN
jgi:membrane associated rhomboid family serine protease